MSSELPPRTAEQEPAYQAHLVAKELDDKRERIRDAAPDLLKALEAMADYYGHELVNSDFPTEGKNMRAALAAIAKATGGRMDE